MLNGFASFFDGMADLISSFFVSILYWLNR